MNIPRLAICSPSSSSGKTSVTCALLSLLKKAFVEGRLPLPPSAVKIGPDFIDPQFHSFCGVKSGNIDLYFSSDSGSSAQIKEIFASDCRASSIAVIEGAMGYYDGQGGDSLKSSSYEVCKELSCPVILLVDAYKKSYSLCAIIEGICSFMEKNGDRSLVSGLILNRCSQKTFDRLVPQIERISKIPVLGFVENLSDSALESRHLGLSTPDSVSSLDKKISILASSLEKSLDLEKLLKIASSAPDLTLNQPVELSERKSPAKVKIAVARDSAFSFYYRENLELLEKFGAEIEFFSPLKNEPLPPDCSALYLGGGYPQLFPMELAENRISAASIKHFARNGGPVFAECGGFLYLQLLGLLPGSFKNEGHLVRFGYCEITAAEDTILCKKGDKIRAHEFHYFDTSENGSACTARKPDGREWNCFASSVPLLQSPASPCSSRRKMIEKNIFAGFPHLYFPSNPVWAENFVLSALLYASSAEEKSCGSCSNCANCGSCKR